MQSENHKAPSGTHDDISWFFGDGDNQVFGKSKGQSFELCVSEGKSTRVPVERIPFKYRELYANTYVGDCYVCPQFGKSCFVPTLIQCSADKDYRGVCIHTDGLYRLFPVIREKKRLKPQPRIAQALDFRR